MLGVFTSKSCNIKNDISGGNSTTAYSKTSGKGGSGTTFTGTLVTGDFLKLL